VPPEVTRARGINERGNSCVLVTGMPASALAEVLAEGGWKYALLDSNGTPAGTVALDVRSLRRTWRKSV